MDNVFSGRATAVIAHWESDLAAIKRPKRQMIEHILKKFVKPMIVQNLQLFDCDKDFEVNLVSAPAKKIKLTFKPKGLALEYILSLGAFKSAEEMEISSRFIDHYINKFNKPLVCKRGGLSA